MNRTTFLVSYILLMPFTFFNDLKIVSLGLGMARGGLGSLMGLLYLLLPIALAVIACKRGRRMGRPRLYRLSIAAILSPFILLVLSALAQRIPALMVIAVTLGSQAPLVLHTICATLGGQLSYAEKSARPVIAVADKPKAAPPAASTSPLNIRYPKDPQ
jgi:hypothetical protein